MSKTEELFQIPARSTMMLELLDVEGCKSAR